MIAIDLPGLERTTFYTTHFGALAGRNLEWIKRIHRPDNAHGDLVLVETALGQRYWVRSINLTRAL